MATVEHELHEKRGDEVHSKVDLLCTKHAGDDICKVCQIEARNRHRYEEPSYHMN